MFAYTMPRPASINTARALPPAPIFLETSQFLSTDPIGTKDDPNLTLYVGVDPVNHTDPTGLYECAPNQDCSAFEEARLRALEAAGNIENARHRRIALAAINAYGELGDSNGVIVRMGDLSTSAASLSVRKSDNSIIVTVDLRENDEVSLVEGIAHEGGHILQFRAGWAIRDTWQSRYNAELPAYFTGFLVRNSLEGRVQSAREIGAESHHRAGIGAAIACANRCPDVPEQFRIRRR
ncbi:MAG: hypothetical protein ACK4E3_03445 [Brevundimonas sp.]|uniref:hypothetical protein n=1 Tax=Brevundimonas sp. TaxID=1871086 RepID=UPI00391D6951